MTLTLNSIATKSSEICMEAKLSPVITYLPSGYRQYVLIWWLIIITAVYLLMYIIQLHKGGQTHPIIMTAHQLCLNIILGMKHINNKLRGAKISWNWGPPLLTHNSPSDAELTHLTVTMYEQLHVYRQSNKFKLKLSNVSK